MPTFSRLVSFSLSTRLSQSFIFYSFFLLIEESDIILEKKIMKGLVEDFKNNTVKLYQELIKKHTMELRKARRQQGQYRSKPKKEKIPSTDVQYLKMQELLPKKDRV